MPYAAWAALFALAPISLASTTHTYTIHPMVEKVDCTEGAGSAVRIGRTLFASVSHVTSLAGCTVRGLPITILHDNSRDDFSVFTVPLPSERWMQIDCGGYVEGRWYLGVGHAGARNWQTAMPLVGTGSRVSIREGGKPMAILYGDKFIPGMSGGMTIDLRTQRLVGVVNAFSPIFPMSFSREMRDTILCPKV